MSLRGTTFVITTPAWLHGDGVGHDVEGMARALIGAGAKVHVYAPFFYAPVYESWRIGVDEIRHLLQDPNSVLIHHHSIGCDENEQLLREAKSRVKILRYHNVTPPEFFVGYNDNWVRNCENGRRVTPNIVALCNEFSVPSLYDARDLVHAGALVDRITYCPYFHKLEDFDRVEPTQEVLHQMRDDDRLNVLFLGRRVNNKGHLHLVRTIAAYVREFDDKIVLRLVGAADEGLARYDAEILQEIEVLGVRENVFLYDKVPFSDIVAFYRGSDVFLCMSEHEGFCIPVIEAEYCGLPVIAHYRRGVPEALGPTQPWFTSLHYPDYARTLRRIRTEPNYATSLGQAGAASVRERFDINSIRMRFIEWLEGLVHDYKIIGNSSLKSQQSKPKIAFVVQRFGSNVSGGAEAFARMYAEALSDIYDITVITTTSRTLDWDNELFASKPDPAEYKVLRFPPRFMRTSADFDNATKKAVQGEMSYDEWQSHQGPHVPELRDFLDKYAEEFNLIVNWTYLYATATYPTFVDDRVPIVNVPFFHDEMWLYMEGCGQNALKYHANIYQTEAERDLATSAIRGINRKPSVVLGCGVDEAVLDEVRNSSTRSPLDQPYVVYVGRVEEAKGIPKLLEDFKKYKNQTGSGLKLVIIGRQHGMNVIGDDDIVLPGFVSEKDKALYMKHALCLINPSHFESFSLVLVESWSLQRPVMVNGACAATKGQVEQSGGGFVYNNFRDFVWCLRTLEGEPEFGDRLGQNGAAFYERNYRWSSLIPKATLFFDSMLARN